MNNSDNFSDITTKLEAFQNVKASQSLHKKITKDILHLSNKHTVPYFPFYLVRLVAIIITILLISTGGLVYAAEQSKPGHFLYPVKKHIETIKVHLTNDSVKKTELHLNNAENNIKEIKESVENKQVDEIKSKSKEYEKEIENALEEIDKNNNDVKGIFNKAQERLQEDVEELEKIKNSAPSQSHSDIERAIKKAEEGKAKSEEQKNNEEKKNENSSENKNNNENKSNDNNNEKGGE